MHKPQADIENKDDSQQRLCHQHTVILHRYTDYVCQTGEKTQHLPLEKNPTCLGHMLQRQMSNAEVLSRTGLSNIALCSACADCAAGSYRPHEASQTPLCGELAQGKEPVALTAAIQGHETREGPI